jgi:hypothetical protein
MSELPQSRLFREALEPRANGDHNAAARERLRASYLDTRGRATLLAKEIARDLPDLTVHDDTHLDALWEMADLVAGEDYTLTPPEAYVLACAILLHDLGLAVAAYPGGRSEIHNDARWGDALIATLEARLGHAPSPAERTTPSSEDIANADRRLLRLLHAERADTLATQAWQTNGDPEYLIADRELRETYGVLIGRIAHSHWWPTGQLSGAFDTTLGPRPWCPPAWTVEPLPLACLLRTADAIHLDARRAPHFLRTLRKPMGDAELHWVFQERLSRPIAKGDRVEFSSGNPFTEDQANAWWLARDTLVDADRWLREVDSLLADSGRERFAMRGVVGVDDTKRLVRLIPTREWIPVDTRLEVSDVARLVSSLGGEQLYGRNRLAPIRELIQNAADATRARRILQTHPPAWGTVSVRLLRNNTRVILEVHDNGVGMAEEVLTGPLLDFGRSFWNTDGVTAEFPGLRDAGFVSTGKYGIGFFSVFMLGRRVSITSRPYRAGETSTKVLDFSDGLAKRALLRPASLSEILTDGGTCVRVWLDESVEALLRSPTGTGSVSLSQLVEWLCPSSDVTIETDEFGKEQTSVVSDDWTSLDPDALLARTAGPTRRRRRKETFTAERQRVANNIRELHSSETCVGRAAITPSPFAHDAFEAIEGVVTVGGLRACHTTYVAGLFLGTSERAARDSAMPVVPSDTLADWASGQAALAKQTWAEPELQYECAAAIALCGGDTADLPIGLIEGRWLSAEQVEAWALGLNEIVVVQDAHASIERSKPGDFQLVDNVIATSGGQPALLQTRETWLDWPTGAWNGRLSSSSLMGRVATATAKAWSMSLEELEQLSEFATDDQDVHGTIATRDGEPIVYYHVSKLRRSTTETPRSARS